MNWRHELIPYLRALEGRRIGGVLVPFLSRDRFRTWWDESSDLMLDLFKRKEVFYHHNFEAQAVGSIGVIESLLRSADGWIAQAEIAEGDLGTAALELARREAAAWSGGFWPTPQTWQVRGDGYVMRSALVEGSVCPKEKVASLPGTTLIKHLRGMPPELAGVSPSDSLKRGIWMPEVTENPVVPQPEPAPVPAAFTLSEGDIDRIANRVATLAPTRSLPANQQVPPAPTAPSISVSSVYDNVSLLGMMLHRRIMEHVSMRSGGTLPYEKDWIGAFFDKARKLVEQDGIDPGQTLHLGAPPMTPFRAISTPAFDAMHRFVPHLRANEVAQSDLAGYADEFVPAVLGSVVYYYFRMESRVLGLFNSFAMPAEVFEYPVFTAGFRLGRVNQPTDASQMTIPTSVFPTRTLGTNKVTFQAGRVGAMLLVGKHLTQATGIRVVDSWMQEMVRSFAAGIDDVLLNGDESATATNISHYGTDPTDTDYDGYLAIDGLRHMAVANSDTAATATIAPETPGTLSKLMGTRGIIGFQALRNGTLVQIVDPGTAYKYRDLAEYEKANEVGPDKATLLTGQVDTVKGVPIVVSDELEYANSSGQVEDSHDGTLGQQVQVNRAGVLVGYLQQQMLDVQYRPELASYVMFGDIALDIQQLEAGMVAQGYNTTVS